MNILIAGAFGKLGTQLTKAAVAAGHRVTAADKVVKGIDGLDGARYAAREIDLTRPDTLEGLCDGMDVVITTVGLTVSSTVVTHYDIDLLGNLNLLNEAKRAGVAKFVFTSVIKADTDASVPMLDAKRRFEVALESSGLDYLIIRPSGYFYDIAKVFMPMIDSGAVRLLKGRTSRANVIDTADVADYILANLERSRETVELGGVETYSYEEIAGLFFSAAGKPAAVRYVPAFLFDLLALIARISGNGKYANILFGKWTLSHDMVAGLAYGQRSFKAYVQSLYPRKA